MVYDYIIVGSGIAGNVCAYLLQRQGKKCLILEKDPIRKEKICGGGIPFKAIKKLSDIGMDITPLLSMDISLIKGDCTFYPDRQVKERCVSGEEAIGCKRILLDEFLLEQAILSGVEIKRGEHVTSISKSDGLYSINGYLSNDIVVASGARGLDSHYTEGQSIGISSQISGECNLQSDIFYFWYYNKIEDRYFWIFPIGRNLWNVGIWFMNPNANMKTEFEECWKKIVDSHFKNDYIYLQKPTGEFCGNVDLRCTDEGIINGIGDFSGVNNIKNGGGIYRAIKSAIRYAETAT